MIRGKYEWKDKNLTYPHLLLVMRSEGVVFQGKLLFCELACIAQAIKNRLEQDELKDTSLFPVRFVNNVPTTIYRVTLQAVNTNHFLNGIF